MKKIDDLHYLAIGDDGEYSTKGKYQSSLEQVEDIVHHLKQNNIEELSLYFHGGLVNESSAEESVSRVLSRLTTRNKPGAETLGFIWKTGLKETITDNLDEVFESKFGNSLRTWAVRALIKRYSRDLTKSALSQEISIPEIKAEFENAKKEKRGAFQELNLNVKTPTKATSIGLDNDEVEESKIEQDMAQELQSYYGLDNEKLKNDWDGLPEKVKSSVESDVLARSSASPKKGLRFYYKLAKAIAKIAIRVYKRYKAGTDHMFHATVVEEICWEYFISDAGQWVWGNMKLKANEMWENKEQRAGYDFIDLLQKELPGIKLNLIGHSAGSIVICHLLQKKRLNNWQINIGKILWWAPACRIDLFIRNVIKHPDDFTSFQIITMHDRYEIKDPLVDDFAWLYPSSLLYFISGVLENKADSPLAGMARYYSNKFPYQGEMFEQIQTFIKPDGRIILSKTEHAPLGMRSHAVDHGRFSSDEPTLESLVEYLR